jgi:hypothetical protein
MKLTDDQQYDLYELLLSDGFKPLLVVIEAHVRDLERAVLEYPLHKGAQGLVETKARAEGARSLAHNLTAFFEAFKAKHKQGE